MLCIRNGHPVPDWIAEPVLKELAVAFNEGTTAAGKGKRGQGALRAKHRNNLVAHARWSQARHWLANWEKLPNWGYPATRDGGFELASKLLRGTPARGEPDMIETSYNEVQKAIEQGEYIAFDGPGYPAPGPPVI
jgi:hypothetical protein